jgi:hypothetical protein
MIKKIIKGTFIPFLSLLGLSILQNFFSILFVGRNSSDINLANLEKGIYDVIPAAKADMPHTYTCPVPDCDFSGCAVSTDISSTCAGSGA